MSRRRLACASVAEMRIVDVDAHARAIDAHGSEGLTIAHLVRVVGEAQLVSLRIAAGGHVGAHEAPIPQLFVCVEGEGWASGADGVRHPLRPGLAALFNEGELHETGTDGGMRALVLEGDAFVRMPW